MRSTLDTGFPVHDAMDVSFAPKPVVTSGKRSENDGCVSAMQEPDFVSRSNGWLSRAESVSGSEIYPRQATVAEGTDEMPLEQF